MQSKHGHLMAVGRAREGGIEVHGSSKLLGYTAFENLAGGADRTAQHPSPAASALEGCCPCCLTPEGAQRNDGCTC
jgi:hypothetical protein